MTAQFGEIRTHRDAIYERYNPDDFIGREWLVDEITKFRDSGEEKIKMIVGEPGSGKSAFLAYLAEKWNCPRHFMRFDNIKGVTGIAPRNFLISIGEQLHQKYGKEIFGEQGGGSTTVAVGIAKDKVEVVGRVIDAVYTLPFFKPADRDIQVRVAYASGDSQVIGERINKLIDVTEALSESELLHVMVINPLKKLQETYPNEIVVIFVDALDESLQQPGVKIPEVIPSPSDPDFPKNLRFVMTSRKGDHLVRFQKHILNIDDVKEGFKERSEEDVKKYIHDRLNRKPLAPVIQKWDDQTQTAYIDDLGKKSERNFLYLYHFFNEINAMVMGGETDLLKVNFPKGLDEIYRDFAVLKIRADVSNAIRFTVRGELEADFVDDLKKISGIKQVDVTGSDVVMELAKDVEDADPVTEKLYDIAEARDLKIKNLKTPKRTDWEKNFLPILGVLAVSYEALSRKQIAEFARVKVTYVDQIISHLKQFLDEVNDETEDRYRIFHLTFAEYLLDETRNRAYPLDGPAYHYQIATTYRSEENWAEVDWKVISDGYIHRHLIQHIHAAKHYADLPVLLLHFPWMLAKLDRTDVNAMMADYEFALKPEAEISTDTTYALRMVRDALRLSAYVLTQDKSQLPSQLLGRMLGFEQSEIRALMDQIKNWKSDRPWLRPLTAFLKHPGGSEMFTLRAHDEEVTEIALTPDGRLAISNSLDGTLKVWDMAQPAATPYTLWKGEHSRHNLTTDGKVLVASYGSDIYVWDLSQLDAKPRIISSAKEGVNSGDCIALTPDGRLKIFHAILGALEVWDLTQPDVKPIILEWDIYAQNSAMTIDGRMVFCDNRPYEGLKLLDLTQADPTPRILGGNSSFPGKPLLSLTPDGRMAVSRSRDGLQIWDLTQSAAKPRILKVHGIIEAISLTPDGRMVAASVDMKTIRVWDLTQPDNKPCITLKAGGICSIDFFSNGQLLVSGSVNGIISVWDLTRPEIESGADLYALENFEGAGTVAFASDGNLVVAGNHNRFDGDEIVIKAWDLKKSSRVPRILMKHEKAQLIVMALDGSRALYASFCDLKLWEMTQPDSMPVILAGFENYVSAIAMTPDGRFAVCGSTDGIIIISDLTQQVVKNYSLKEKDQTTLALATSIQAVTITSDGRFAASASKWETIQVWDLAQSDAEPRTLVKPFKDLSSHPSVIGLTSNGQQVVWGTVTGDFRVWNIAQGGDMARSLIQERSPICAIALIPNGFLAISCSESGTVRVWDIKRDQLITTFNFVPNGSIMGLTFVKDGRIICVDETGRLYFFYLEGLKD